LRRFGSRLDVELLKVGHHGSSTSTSDSLLMRASPEVALISVGRNNRYGHPSPDVLARLSRSGVRVLRSDQHGTVRVRAFADGSLDVRAGL
jgi:competence protein ComEC